MSTVTEIEAAIERLPPDELRALLNWIEEYAAAIGASETLFGMYDAEEEHSGAESQVRPVLVLSVAYEGQERAIVSYVIRTTSLRGTRYEVRHETRGMPNGAFDAQGLGSIPEINASTSFAYT